MRTQQAKEGYLCVDGREVGTQTCSHCQAIVIMNPDRTRARPYCPKCDHYICDNCEAIRVASGGACRPFAQLLDQAQERLARGQPIGDLLNGQA